MAPTINDNPEEAALKAKQEKDDDFNFSHYGGTCPQMPVNELEFLIEELKRVRDTATMDRANFDPFDHGKLTAMIRKVTKVWRETWIVYPLEGLIYRYERQLARQRGEKWPQ